MVNICDTFTRMYGRKPSASELASMMRMKAEQDSFKNRNMKKKVGAMELSGPCQERSKAASAKRNPDGAIVVSKLTMKISRLLEVGLTAEQIAYALFIEVPNVKGHIVRFKLPRSNLKQKT
jgi:DNA-binding NarL/FixJ family response regulator